MKCLRGLLKMMPEQLYKYHQIRMYFRYIYYMDLAQFFAGQYDCKNIPWEDVHFWIAENLITPFMIVGMFINIFGEMLMNMKESLEDEEE